MSGINHYSTISGVNTRFKKELSAAKVTMLCSFLHLTVASDVRRGTGPFEPTTHLVSTSLHRPLKTLAYAR